MKFPFNKLPKIAFFPFKTNGFLEIPPVQLESFSSNFHNLMNLKPKVIIKFSCQTIL